MKTVAIAVASIFTALAPAAFAQNNDYRDNNRDTYQDRQWSRGRDIARVVESRPIYNAANSHEECWNPRAGVYEELRNNEGHSVINKGTAIGAVAGGVLGHQVDNNNTGTAIGAVLGGLIGNQVDKGRNTDGEQNDLDRSRCRVTRQGGDIQGYEVKYAYRGNQYVTRMDHMPGSTLRVGDDIRSDGRPVEPIAWR
ncbi:MAG: glycine zipper 2TM domain-containing protein [Usitatibacter sp.]